MRIEFPDLETYLEDPAPVRGWLLTQAAGDIVGAAHEPNNCPLQHCLASLYPLPEGYSYYVEPEDLEVHDEDGVCERVPLERWAQWFVYKMDHGDSDMIAQNEALAALDAIMASRAFYERMAPQELTDDTSDDDTEDEEDESLWADEFDDDDTEDEEC